MRQALYRHLVRLVVETVEQMDLSQMIQAYRGRALWLITRRDSPVSLKPAMQSQGSSRE